MNTTTPSLPSMKRMLDANADLSAKRARVAEQNRDRITRSMQKFSTPLASRFFTEHNTLLEQACALTKDVSIEKTTTVLPSPSDIESVNAFFSKTGDRLTRMVDNSKKYQQLIEESSMLLERYHETLHVLQNSPPEDLRKHSEGLMRILYGMTTLERMKSSFYVKESACMRDILVHTHSLCSKIKKET